MLSLCSLKLLFTASTRKPCRLQKKEKTPWRPAQLHFSHDCWSYIKFLVSTWAELAVLQHKRPADVPWGWNWPLVTQSSCPLFKCDSITSSGADPEGDQGWHVPSSLKSVQTPQNPKLWLVLCCNCVKTVWVLPAAVFIMHSTLASITTGTYEAFENVKVKHIGL